MANMIRAVVFDLGQVLASPPDIHSYPAELLGVPTEAFQAGYWTGRQGYDEGGADADYWGPILTSVGRDPDADTVQLLAETDATIWTRIRPEAERLLADVHATGLPVALLSNAPRALGAAIDAASWRRHFDHVFVSALIGTAKPKKAIYDHAAAVLDVPAGSIAFIDDRPENVAGAAAAGWRAHLWRDDADTRNWLIDLGVL